MFASIFSRDPTKDFGYEIQDPVHSYNGCSFWALHKAVKKGTSEEFSVFVYDAQKQGDSWLSAAKSSMKRLKTMRHPNILTFVDGLETDKVVYMVTESVTPLMEYIQKLTKKSDHLLSWGLLQVAKALSFFNETANLAHHNVSVNSVFVNKAGEWKLGGLDYVTPADSDSAPSLGHLKGYLEPPEYTKGGGGRRNGEKWSADMWGYGILIYEVFKGTIPSRDALQQINNLPELVRPHYPALIATNPKSRTSPSEFIKVCTANRGFFHNNVIDSMAFLDEIQLKSAEEKGRFFGKLSELVESLPEEMCTYRVLPQLITTFEFGPADNSMLPILLKLGKGLKDEEYQKRVIPVVVKLFSSTDRGTRMQLLQQMKFYIDHLSNSIVNTQIFPHIVNGFLDTNPAIREETVKSVVLLAPKLNSKNMNEEVMKHFARVQAKDEQGSIRTNTTVCIGKVAPCLNPDVRLKVLVSAFSRALRDPFPPCRVSGAVGFAVTYEFFSLNDVAARVLPSLCAALTDVDKEVRDQVFKSTKLFLDRLEKVSEKPELKDEMEAKVNAGGVNIVNAAANWAGWAVSSLQAKFTKAKTTDGASDGPNAKPTEGGESPANRSPKAAVRSSGTPSVESNFAPSPLASESVDDWLSSQETKSTFPSSSSTAFVSNSSDGWDDADWNSPIDALPANKAGGLPVISPPPPPSNRLKSSNANPFADLNNDDIFSAPKTSVKPAGASGQLKTSYNPQPAVASSTTKKATTPQQNGSWDSWDTWDTKDQPGLLKPTPVKPVPTNKSMKLTPKKPDFT
ncbi:N-terminal [Hypsibius exemplaris]|uniref:N-terminal kinase-like protein n=1 Tax=Hypsibius exemplaris TaxID=2072580 RepID=A0A1W0WCX3_HYPEX|nr:N-terminal [Hypsibius exemplaris]